ncbi:MAG: hypothetical protein KKI08_03620 [Armatimonadetes bacterium]|nr:hypothetical protein [Armatimonadota bacterium]
MRHLMVPLLLLSCSLALAQGSFYKTTDGTWKPLKATTAGAITKFSLAPEDIGGGSTLIVVNKPKWMVLDDTTPPAVVKILLDGQERAAEDLDLGAVTAAPGELAFAIKDDKNPLDGDEVRVTLDGQPLPAAQVAIVKLTPDGKSLRIAAKVGTVAEARHVLSVLVSDMAPERNSTTLTLKFSTAPLLANGSFEQVDNQGNPVGWAPGAWSSDAATKYEAGVMDGGGAGKKAFRFVGVGGSLNLVLTQQLEPLKVGAPYVLTGQYKSEGGAGISVITTAEGKDKSEYLTHPLPAVKEWTPFSYEFQLKAHESLLIVPRTGSKGETWFDDLKLDLK